MADLTSEQFESLPEFVKGDYEQSGEVYRPKAEGKAASLKASLDALDGKFKTTDAKLKEILAKHEDDRTKAENAALERLKKEGKVDEILADYERRSTETKKQYDERIERLSGIIKADVQEIELSSISSQLGVFKESEKLFKKLYKDRISVDPETRKITYLDENGGATSLDKAGFIADLEKDESLDRIRQGKVNTGGVATGNNGTGGGASQVMKRSDFEAMTPAARAKFMKDGGKLKD